MEARLDEMKAQRKTMDVLVAEKTKRNDELKVRLRELKSEQERVADYLEKSKAEKTRLASTLEAQTEKTLAARHESAKLRPYVLQSPTALHSSLTDLADSLARDRAAIDTLERRARALHTSTDAFLALHADITSCAKTLQELAADLGKEDEESARAAKRREALSERGNNVREIERTEALLQRQLKRWTERTEQVRRQGRERADTAKQRMEELRQVHKGLVEMRGEKGREVERRRVRVEQVEKKMADLKENVESEIREAHEEYLKMEAHIRLYVREMGAAI